MVRSQIAAALPDLALLEISALGRNGLERFASGSFLSRSDSVSPDYYTDERRTWSRDHREKAILRA
jgi:hypothetical protein